MRYSFDVIIDESISKIIIFVLNLSSATTLTAMGVQRRAV
jgi:hypothetical protein